MDYVTIDFEASCLPRHGRSFPIEVGICGDEGATAWLIQPHTSWRDWDWTEEAFRIHGIARERLEREGIGAEHVFADLVCAIDGRRIIADSRLDSVWWDTLSLAAGWRPPTRVEHVSTVVESTGMDADAILAARQRADALCPGRHRAAEDARWLWTLLSSLPAQAAGRLATPPPAGIVSARRSVLPAATHALA